jgi:hypothetical protein
MSWIRNTEKRKEKKFSCFSVQCLVSETPDPNPEPDPYPDPDSLKMLDQVRIRIRIQ